MWKCKDCSLSFSERSELLKHYRIDRRFHGRCRPYPCIHANCPCSSKTWNGLQKHLTRNHPSQESTQKVSSFTVILSSSSSERLRTEPWPKEFNKKGNAEYTKNQTRLTPSSKMLSDILERLAEKIFSYKAYPLMQTWVMLQRL